MKALLLLLPAMAFAEDWSPQRAARYLDSRQAEWFAWKQAQSADGPCVSCHTGLTYLLARPVLGAALSETAPTEFEKGLLARLRSKAGAKPAGSLQVVETIFTALFIPRTSSGLTLDADTRRAFDQLWALQVLEGRLQGSWRWYSAELDPFETSESAFFGGSLAAMAVAATPAPYRNEPDVRERIHQLTEYFRRELPNQPLHNRLALLWASSKLAGILAEEDRKSIIEETLKKQGVDGGWTLESLGPWVKREHAPTQPGSNSYATAFAAFVLREGGVEPAKLARAHSWLRAHQDPKTGAWPALSMNKPYPADSMQIKFMQDAATAFAALALLQ